MNELKHEGLKVLAVELPDEVLKYKMAGDFAGAAAAIERWLQRPVGEEMKTRLHFEQLFLRRLPEQFPFTAEQAVAEFAKLIPDFSEKDLRRVDEAGLAEWIFLNGEKHYIFNIVRNVTRVDEELARRAGTAEDEDEEKKILKETIADIKANKSVTWDFKVQETTRLADDLFQPGMKLKVHLPVSAELFQTSDVKVTSWSEGMSVIDPPDAPFRSICFEDTLQENREFYVEYEYTVTSEYHDFSREDYEACLQKSQETPEALQPYLEEQYPHIRFSPYLKSLAAEIVGYEKDPLAMARMIYDYITTKVHYSYMREYFLIPDIPQYCARNLRGDCGVQALLFITLCRICGIPAKWQSGLYAIPGYIGPHDWAMFYVAPYGWLFADPSFGGSAYRDGDEERRKFYFGNLDPFRVTANNAFQQNFASPKQFLPVDPYDNQTGEMESDKCGFGKDDMIQTSSILFARRREA
ncbi:MAG: transglutaminase domain-containing protein [Lachnospiraceae bacterium]|nr:transglutaminase domain-containing protein [Lachnospiraceae bacterium]